MELANISVFDLRGAVAGEILGKFYVIFRKILHDIILNIHKIADFARTDLQNAELFANPLQNSFHQVQILMDLILVNSVPIYLQNSCCCACF